MNLKDLIVKFRSEFSKGDQADRSALEDLVEQMEPIASRDYATIKKLEKRAEGKTDVDVSSLEDKIQELSEALATKGRESDKAIKSLAQERDSYKAAADAERVAVSKLILEGGLTDALTKAGVRKELLPAARALLRERGALTVKVEGDARKAVASKDGKELDLEAFVTDFIGSDEGKAYIPAGLNSGGGAQAGSGGATAKTMPLAQYAALPGKDQAAFLRDGGTLTE